jgi:hypothetical protein
MIQNLHTILLKSTNAGLLLFKGSLRRSVKGLDQWKEEEFARSLQKLLENSKAFGDK